MFGISDVAISIGLDNEIYCYVINIIIAHCGCHVMYMYVFDPWPLLFYKSWSTTSVYRLAVGVVGESQCSICLYVWLLEWLIPDPDKVDIVQSHMWPSVQNPRGQFRQRSSRLIYSRLRSHWFEACMGLSEKLVFYQGRSRWQKGDGEAPTLSLPPTFYG